MPDEPRQQSLFADEAQAAPSGPVECLGETYESEEARRRHFLGRLEAALPELRKRPDFSAGTDEDILRLSDPPYYTACPNPFLTEILSHHGSVDTAPPADDERRLPYTGPMSPSRKHAVYNFHPYSTKVPPDIIRTLVEHYTAPGDVVFDGFCGTGMTGVAAREAGRFALVSDLSPVATFITATNTRSHDWVQATAALRRILKESSAKWGHLYETEVGPRSAAVNYFVWSDVFTCPECAFEFPFFPHGVIHHGTKVQTRKAFPCPSCKEALNVRKVERVLIDGGKKRRLVWVNAGTGRRRINRPPTEADLALAEEAQKVEVTAWFPTDPIDPDGYSAKLAQLGDKGISDVSRFLSKRNLIVLADLWERVQSLADASIRRLATATLTSVFTVISERQGYFGGGGGMSGNLYMPIVRMEKNIYDVVERKLTKLMQAEKLKAGLALPVAVTTESATSLSSVPDACIDYIYTDPPFGANIIYSEMNLVLEGWLRVKTNAGGEAVIDSTRDRDFDDYATLMREAFSEFFRILKPGRWMTVEFHNTHASVWNLIQNAIGDSGFVVAQVGVLDKGSTTILADIRPGAAKQDLLISAYRPSAVPERRFSLQTGTVEGAWQFVRSHLLELPIVPSAGVRGDVIAERQDYLLFDRMVAFHVGRGRTVPLSAAEFYQELGQRFEQRDQMYFLPDQAAEYDRTGRGRQAEPELPR